MSDHLLHVTPDQEGYCTWEMTCGHPKSDPRFRPVDEGEGWVGCNLKSWWDAVGQELVGAGEWPTLIVPVVGDWTGYNGEDGPIIKPEAAP